MGYEIHITRKNNWLDNDSQNDISLEQWNEYVESDDEMTLEKFAETVSPNGDVIRIEKEGLSVWSGHTNSYKVWFNWFGGEISVKNPDDEIVNKMIKIAKRLDAKVLGDEGETYFE